MTHQPSRILMVAYPGCWTLKGKESVMLPLGDRLGKA